MVLLLGGSYTLLLLFLCLVMRADLLPGMSGLSSLMDDDDGNDEDEDVIGRPPVVALEEGNSVPPFSFFLPKIPILLFLLDLFHSAVL